MRTTTRVMLAAAAVLLGLAYAAPLWHIGLDAPQYPEGIGMYIWIDRILGQKPNDLNSINNLNHYIGMKAIVPDAIPELRLMPRIVAVLIGLGLFAALAGRRTLLYAWTAIFAVVAAGGLVDFWYWGYTYGHELDPTAAIKIPGFSYQPPVLGTRQLLNFTAHSWPGGGGWAIAIALAAGLALCVVELRRNRRHPHPGIPLRRAAAAVIGVTLLAAGSGCAAAAPAPLHYGSDACDHCRMTIFDPSFAAQIVTRTGKQYRFDDPGCLLEFMASGQLAPAGVHSLWVNDRADPARRTTVAEAVFVVSDRIRAPMGGHMAAFSSRGAAMAFQAAVGGELRSWSEIAKRVAR